MFTNIERLISLRNLKPKKKEGFLKVISTFSFLGIMLGVSILIIVMSVMNGFRTDLTNKILGLNPHIVITSSGSKVNKDYFKKFEKKYNKINFVQTYSGEGIILSKESAKGILIKGINNKDTKKFFLEDNLVLGKLSEFKSGTAIIGNELAFNLDLDVGDNLLIMSSAFVNTPIGGAPKQETYLVNGIFNSGFLEFDQNLVFINLDDAISLFDKKKEDLNSEIYLKDPLKADALKKEIQKDNNDFYIYSWSDLNKSFFSALKVERNVMFLILILIIIVAAFNIISGLTILIKNKTKEIAILKSLGLSDTSIKKSFFLTGFTIGFFATLAGALIGVLFSYYIENIRIFLSSVFDINIFPEDVYILDKMPSEIDILSVLLIFISSLIINAIASYLPSRAISKMEITKALKYE